MCERLDITLIHAKPRQPKSRGKMERLWRTLREQCLDYVAENANLAQLNAHLATFRLDYRTSPHASLMGDTPQRTVAQGEAKSVDEAQLRAAFTVDQFRKVKGDSTLQIGGKTYQVKEHHLAGRRVRVQVSLLDERPHDFVTYQKQEYRLEPVDPIDNGRLRRNPVKTETPKKTGFDPNKSRTRQVVEAIKKAEKDAR